MITEAMTNQQIADKVLGDPHGNTVDTEKAWLHQLASAVSEKPTKDELWTRLSAAQDALGHIFLMDKCPDPGDGCAQCIARAALIGIPYENLRPYLISQSTAKVKK